MISLEKIINHYQKVWILIGNRIREDLFLKKLIFKFCEEIHKENNLPGSIDPIWDYQLLRSLISNKD